MTTQVTTAHPVRTMRFKVTARLWRLVLYVLVFSLCIMFGFPIFWTLMSSLKTPGEMSAFPPVIIPSAFQWENYRQVLMVPRIPVARWAFNSTLVVTLVTTGALITSSLFLLFAII